jgi:hypothetical protein
VTTLKLPLVPITQPRVSKRRPAWTNASAAAVSNGDRPG